ncbi:MAG: DUF4129 domain-containing protein, partial [Anaerolineaceae bacterium]|nr:DUF4129 domain-containing protein [Anaerolineaceae bacterium]
GKLPALQKVWGLGIPAAALFIIGLSVFAGWLSNGSLAPAATALIMILLGLFVGIIALLAIPVVMLLSFVVPGILDLIKKYLVDFLNQNKNLLNILNPVSPDKNAGVASIINTGTLIGLLLFAGFLVFLIFLDLQRKSKKQHLEQEGDQYNSSYQGKIPSAADLKKSRNLFGLKSWLVAERVRKIYIQLLELCFRLDMKREDADTPQEFLAQMYSLFPDCIEELKTVTDAYEKVRYGKLPERSIEIDSVTKAWEKISQAGNKLILARKKLVKEINYH